MTDTAATPEKIFANGLLGILQPLGQEYDTRISALQQSQAMLADKIDSLTKELESCVSEAEFVDVSLYITKLQFARKKIFAVSSTLHTISERITRLNKSAAAKYPELQKLQEMQKKRSAEQQQQQQQQDGATTTNQATAQQESETTTTQESTNTETSKPEEAAVPPQQEQQPEAVVTETATPEQATTTPANTETTIDKAE